MAVHVQSSERTARLGENLKVKVRVKSKRIIMTAESHSPVDVKWKTLNIKYLSEKFSYKSPSINFLRLIFHFSHLNNRIIFIIYKSVNKIKKSLPVEHWTLNIVVESQQYSLVKSPIYFLNSENSSLFFLQKNGLKSHYEFI